MACLALFMSDDFSYIKYYSVHSSLTNISVSNEKLIRILIQFTKTRLGPQTIPFFIHFTSLLIAFFECNISTICQT